MINNTFLIAVSAGILACIVNIRGICVINKFADWDKKNIVYFTLFALGVLIPVSFMRIIQKKF